MQELPYKINKGVNRPVEFRGLKAQYIYYLALGLAVLLILFCVLYISGTPVYLSLFILLVLGGGLFVSVSRLSRRYGAYGLMKRYAARRLPYAIKCTSLRTFRSLNLKTGVKR